MFYNRAFFVAFAQTVFGLLQKPSYISSSDLNGFVDAQYVVMQVINKCPCMFHTCCIFYTRGEVDMANGADSMGHGGYVPPTITNGWARGAP